MANLKTLKPFKKGEDKRRNLEGRPKGIPNRSTIARLVLEMKGNPPEEVLRYLQQYYPDYFKKKGEKWTNEFLGYLRMMLNALLKGDSRSFELILDSAYGKAQESIEAKFAGLEKVIIEIVKPKEDADKT